MGRRPHRAKVCSSLAGLTLIELLLAIAISVLLAAILYSLYGALARTARSQKERRLASAPRRTAFDLLQHDIRGVFLNEDDESCVFTVAPGEIQPELFDQLSFCRAAPSREVSALAWAEMSHVVYRVAQDDGGPLALLREETPLVGPGSLLPPQTRILLKRPARFQVEVFDGTAWQASWPPAGEHGKPRALRVRAESAAGKAVVHGEFYIPAGNTIGKEPEGENATQP